MTSLPRKDSKVVSRPDLQMMKRVLRKVADRSMDEDAFGKELAALIYPTISTDLIVICDVLSQILGERRL